MATKSGSLMHLDVSGTKLELQKCSGNSGFICTKKDMRRQGCTRSKTALRPVSRSVSGPLPPHGGNGGGKAVSGAMNGVKLLRTAKRVATWLVTVPPGVKTVT